MDEADGASDSSGALAVLCGVLGPGDWGLDWIFWHKIEVSGGFRCYFLLKNRKRLEQNMTRLKPTFSMLSLVLFTLAATVRGATVVHAMRVE